MPLISTALFKELTVGNSYDKFVIARLAAYLPVKLQHTTRNDIQRIRVRRGLRITNPLRPPVI